MAPPARGRRRAGRPADPDRQHAGAHRAARVDGARAPARRRDLRRGTQQARRPARPAGRVDREGRPVEARARAHALRAAHHRRQGRPADGAVRDRRDPLGDGRGAALQQDARSITRSASRASPSTTGSSRRGRSAPIRRTRSPTRCSTRSPRRRSRRRRSPSSPASSRRCTSCRSARAKWRRSAACTKCCSSNGSSATATSARSPRASRTPIPTSSASAPSASRATSCSTR